uniref:alpha-1,2-Mannosidase n=1 Tax=Anopheles farauti TaxID=69004 RepID=A0A182Q600_9DIPT
MSAVATAMFLVAMTGVTLVVRQQRDLEHQPNRAQRYQERFLDYDDHIRFSGLGTAGGPEPADLGPNPDGRSHQDEYYRYSHSKRELGTSDGGGDGDDDDEETRVRRSLYDSSSYVPRYTNATGWLRIEDGPGSPTFPGGGSIDHEKRNHVRQMMVHAWSNYKLYAWGKNELRPLSKRGHSNSIFGSFDLGATIVDGLDTLYLMGLHKEFDEGREWVERKFTLDNVDADLSVFETNIRFVGGFLTCYAFTGDRLFLEKARHVADKLLPAFQTPTGIPYALVNVRNGSHFLFLSILHFPAATLSDPELIPHLSECSS